VSTPRGDGTAHVVEALLRLARGEDPRRPGAVITSELCGHWEHDAPCRWPHHTSAEQDGEMLRIRTALVAPAHEAVEVLARVAVALRADPGWRVEGVGEVEPTAAERELTDRWLGGRAR